MLKTQVKHNTRHAKVKIFLLFIFSFLFNSPLTANTIAFVVGDNTSLDANLDTPLKNHLETTLGHTLTVKDDGDSSYDPTTFDVVVISESASSSNTAWLKTRAVGILTVEGSNYDELEMGSGGDSGTSDSDGDVNITNTSHYITSGQALGNLTISASNSNLGFMSGWANDVTLLASSFDDATEAWLVFVEAGGTLQAGVNTASHRRVFIGGRYFSNLNAAGIAIFNRALTWAFADLSSSNVQPASLAVGTTNNVTVSFTTTGSIAADGKIEVTFGTGFDLTSVGAVSSSDIDGTFSTSVAGQVLTITRQNDGTAEPFGAISLSIANIRNPLSLGSTGSYSIRILDANNVESESDTAITADTITVGSLSSNNVEPTALTVGTTNNAVCSFTTLGTLPADGKIEITFGAGFDLTSIGASDASSANIDGTFSVAVVGQVVTITRQNDGTATAPAALAITLANVKNPLTLGSTGTYSIKTLSSASATIESDTAVSADTIIAGSLSSTNVAPADLTVGTTNNAVCSFTTLGTLPADGKIEITFGAGFDLTSIGASDASSANIDGTFSVAVVGQVVTITRQNDGTATAPAALAITLANVKNPITLGSTGTYSIKTLSSASATIESDTAVSADTIIAGSLSSTNVAPADLTVGTTNNAVCSFTTLGTLPADGKIEITFGAGFDLTSIGASDASSANIDGTFSVAVVGQVVTITRQNDGTATAPAALAITLANVKNPLTLGSTGTYSIKTLSSASATIESDTAVSADTITLGSITVSNVEPSNLKPGKVTTALATFTMPVALDNNGKIIIVFPSGFVLNQVTSASISSSSINGGFSVAVSGTTLTITRDGTGTSTAAGALSLNIANVQNPGNIGTTNNYSILYQDSIGTTIASNTAISGDLINHTPTITYLAEEPYSSDASDPDNFNGGTLVTFRVNYTDLDNEAPHLMQIWIDEDNDGYELHEKHHMSPLDRKDLKYSDGKIYHFHKIIYYNSASVPYKFSFYDPQGASAIGNASGTPANRLTVNAYQDIPSLTFPSGPSVNGVNSSATGGNSGTSGETFRLQAVYTDSNNLFGIPATLAEAYVDINNDGNYSQSEIFTMTQLDPSDTNYSDGAIYYRDLKLYQSSSVNINYYFVFSNGNNFATGTPTSTQTLTLNNSVDSDGDNISDIEESVGGDFDNDGLSDKNDPDTAVYSRVDGSIMKMDLNETSTGAVITSTTLYGSNDPILGDLKGQPTGLNWKGDFIKFNATVTNSGDTVSVTIVYPEKIGAEDQLWNYNTTTKNWTRIDYTLVSEYQISYKIKDGSILDADGTANGVIVDPVGIGTPPSIPGGGGGIIYRNKHHRWCLITKTPNSEKLFAYFILSFLFILIIGKNKVSSL